MQTAMRVTLTTLITVTLGRAAFAHDGLRENLAIIRQYRARHFLASLAVAITAVSAGWGLDTAVPVASGAWRGAREHFCAGHGNSNPSGALHRPSTVLAWPAETPPARTVAPWKAPTCEVSAGHRHTA